MKNKKIILASIVVLLLGALLTYQYIQRTEKNSLADDKKITQEKKNSGEMFSDDDVVENENSIIYFYGAECSHCRDVAAYMERNDIYNKVDFIKKEVWHNKKNGEALRNAALQCGLNPSGIGVPFVFSENKCYIGGPDVMNFFAQKAGLEN